MIGETTIDRLGWVRAIRVLGMATAMAAGAVMGPAMTTPVLAAPGELLQEWTFDSDLDGWDPDGRGPRGAGEWGVAVWFERDGGVARLSGVGGKGRPNSSLAMEVDVPADGGVLTFRASADDDHDFADSRLRVLVIAEGTPTVIHDAVYTNSTTELLWTDVELDVSAYGGTTVLLVFEQDDDGEGEHEHIYLDDVRLYSAGCSLGGTVRTNDPAADPTAPAIPDVRVELLKGDVVEAGPVATDVAGVYCLRAPAPDDSSEYRIRATLVDARHDPPIFSTADGSGPGGNAAGPASVELPITRDAWGDEQIEIGFAATTARPSLPDVATIHYESWRFVSWLTGPLGLTPAQLGSLTIDTFDLRGTRYSRDDRKVFIAAADSPRTARATAASMCPENCEWHEIGHHVAMQLGIASPSAAACAGQDNHGGWKNATTCDSVLEAVPMFLATAASLDLDTGRGAGYATPAYAVFGSLENNGFRPWTFETSGDGSVFEREDIAVAQLLWDLADETPQESSRYGLDDPRFPPDAEIVLRDQAALGVPGLIRLLSAAQADTVAGIRDALLADPDLPADLRQPHPDTVPVAASLTLLEEVFVLHGFHPVSSRYPNVDEFRPDAAGAGTTDRPATLAPGAAIEARGHTLPVPGSAIRLQNPGVTAVTFEIDVAYPDDAIHFEVTVEAGTGALVHLEVPAPWVGTSPDGALPDCATEGLQLTRITITAQRTDARTIDSCEYLHAIAATTDEAVVTYTAVVASTASAAPSSAGPTPAASAGPAGPSDLSGGPGGLVIVGIVGVLLLLGGALFLLSRRRRGAA